MRRRVCAQRFIAYLCCFLLNVPVLAQAHTIGPNGPIPVERAPLRLPVPESNPAPTPAAEPEYSPAESSTTARYNKEIYYIHADHLNTPRAITNGEQRKVWQWGNIDPFGKNAADENPERQGGFAFNLRFPGQYYDRETGLHYNWHRDYDPGVGRYVQSDPIGLEGGLNTYGYVGGNPLAYTDPTGEVIPLTLIAAFGGMGIEFAFQMLAGTVLTDGDWRKALRCIDYGDILIAGIFGALGPGFLSSFLGLADKGLIRHGISSGVLEQKYLKLIYLKYIIPNAIVWKTVMPEFKLFASDCGDECHGISFLNLLKALFDKLKPTVPDTPLYPPNLPEYSTPTV